MLLGLGESSEGVIRFFAIFLHHSLLYVLVLLLNPLFLCCLHLLPDFSVHCIRVVLLQCFCTSIVSAAVSDRTDPESRL